MHILPLPVTPSAQEADFAEVPCRIEGCGRCVVPYDENEWCGLARIYGLRDCPESPLCGSQATVDKWIASGLWD